MTLNPDLDLDLHLIQQKNVIHVFFFPGKTHKKTQQQQKLLKWQQKKKQHGQQETNNIWSRYR